MRASLPLAGATSFSLRAALERPVFWQDQRDDKKVRAQALALRLQPSMPDSATAVLVDAGHLSCQDSLPLHLVQRVDALAHISGLQAALMLAVPAPMRATEAGVMQKWECELL